MLDVTKSLPEGPLELRAFTALLLAEVRSQAVLIEKLRHQLAGHRAHRFVASSETAEQLQLALETREIAIAALTAKLRLPDDTPADKPKRKPIPDHIPRMEVELTPSSAECAHCGGKLRRLGEDVTEELEYVPGRFVVNRPACIRTQNHDLSGCAGRGALAWPVPAAIASRSHLCRHARSNAGVPVRAFSRMCWSTSRRGPWPQWGRVSPGDADHLPLYRQSQIFERDGLDLDRSTLADWVGKSTALLAPLADAIGRHVLAGQAIFADDTPVAMLAPGTGKTQTARLWAYGRDER